MTRCGRGFKRCRRELAGGVSYRFADAKSEIADAKWHDAVANSAVAFANP
jgi:hypothetical protein